MQTSPHANAALVAAASRHCECSTAEIARGAGKGDCSQEDLKYLEVEQPAHCCLGDPGTQEHRKGCPYPSLPPRPALFLVPPLKIISDSLSHNDSEEENAKVCW